MNDVLDECSGVAQAKHDVPGTGEGDLAEEDSDSDMELYSVTPREPVKTPFSGGMSLGLALGGGKQRTQLKST